MQAEDRLIIALDVDNIDSASEAVSELKGTVKNVKVGGLLFSSCGPAAVDMLRREGMEIFLDLKLHDIPSTVENVSRALCRMDIKMFDVHASGGGAMIEAAVKAASESPGKPLVLAVTVLTHFNSRMLKSDLGINREVPEHVLSLASLAVSSGAGGIICSPHEISIIRKAFGDRITIVTPGIRPEGAETDDQHRIFTPGRAAAEGADYIVVGRPVMNAPDRKKAAEEILRSIDERI